MMLHLATGMQLLWPSDDLQQRKVGVRGRNHIQYPTSSDVNNV